MFLVSPDPPVVSQERILQGALRSCYVILHTEAENERERERGPCHRPVDFGHCLFAFRTTFRANNAHSVPGEDGYLISCLHSHKAPSFWRLPGCL